VPIIFPTEITAGLTLSVPLDLPDYPQPEWTVTAHLRGPQPIDIEAAVVADELRISASPVESAAWTPGAYWLTLRAVSATDVCEIDTGPVRIREDVSAAGAGYDGRTHAAKVLDAIKAVIEGRATLDQDGYKINNRELKRTPIGDLLTLRRQYEAEVANERNAASGRPRSIGRNHLVTFK
jgi:hypothetical protein